MSAQEISPRRPLDGAPTFNLQHRLQRLLWSAAWFVLASWTPTPLHHWRIALLRLFGAKVDWNAKLYSSVKVWYPPNLTMAAHSCLGPGVNCYCMAPISLGTHALVSQGAYLCGGTHDIDDPNFPLVTGPISIEADAWVAANSFVGPGVHVGRGAVLGACSVTFKDLAEETVYVGAPARPVRKRRMAQ
jgi:putative colanic acid biosynthesis acetyltransferase WcaF